MPTFTLDMTSCFSEVDIFNDLSARVKERVIELFEDSGESTDLYDAFEKRCYAGIRGSPYNVLRDILREMLKPLIRQAEEDVSETQEEEEHSEAESE